MKQYRLLKDINSIDFTAKAGDIGTSNPTELSYDNSCKVWFDNNRYYFYLNKIKENLGIWFEEVPVVSKPERIIVEGIFRTTAPYKDNVYGIHLNQPLPEKEFPEIKLKIESALNNDTVVEDKNMSTVYFDKQVLNPHAQGTQEYTNFEQGFMEAANKYFKPSSLNQNTNDTGKEEKHKCNFCGAWTSQDDKYCYKNPNGISMHDEQPSNDNAFIGPASLSEHPQCKKDNAFVWTPELINEFMNDGEKYYYDWLPEIKIFEQAKQSEPLPDNKQKWQVLEFRYQTAKTNYATLASNGRYYAGGNFLTLEEMLTTSWLIHSVKRLSDNTIFSVGVRYKDSMNRVLKPVKKFFIKEGVMYAQFDEGHGNNDGCLGINSLQILSSQSTTDKPIEVKIEMTYREITKSLFITSYGFTNHVVHTMVSSLKSVMFAQLLNSEKSPEEVNSGVSWNVSLKS